jgi:hypothetical protein
LIAQKRKEKNLRVKIKGEASPCDGDQSSPLEDQSIPHLPDTQLEPDPQADPLSQSSFFNYSREDNGMDPTILQESNLSPPNVSYPNDPDPSDPDLDDSTSDDDSSDLLSPNLIAASSNLDPEPPLTDSTADGNDQKNDAEMFSSDESDIESESDDLEYGNLILAMKHVIENSDQAEDLDEFEEEGEEEEQGIGLHFEGIEEEDITGNLSWSLGEQPNDDPPHLDPPHPSAEEILSQAEDLFNEVPKYREQISHNENDDDASAGSWDEFSDPEDPPVPAHGLTVFGLPFPLGKTVCNENGLNLECNTPASRMEALREYLENSLGTDRFIKVYRLLKSVGPKDDDDELLKSMESVVGVEGLHFMDAFFQLIHIEDKFESGEW